MYFFCSPLPLEAFFPAKLQKQYNDTSLRGEKATVHLTAVTKALPPAKLDLVLFSCTQDKAFTSEVLKGSFVPVTEVSSKAVHG